MKKLTLLGITALSILTLAACSNTTSKQEATASSSAAETTTSSSVKEKAAISADEAKAIALEKAGLTEDDIYNLSVRMDTEDGKQVYEIDFDADMLEFSYEVDATTGDVRESERETADGNAASAQDESEAKQIALDDAGTSEDSVTNFVVQYDTEDDGTEVIEINFDYNGSEYEYTITADTHEIIEKSVESVND